MLAKREGFVRKLAGITPELLMQNARPVSVSLFSTFIILMIMMQPGLADGDVEKGEALSRLHCARCHVVAEDDPFAGIGSTPSFMLLVNALKDWEERFATFYARRPHPVHVRVEGIAQWTSLPSNATPIKLILEDVEDILAYARSLKKE